MVPLFLIDIQILNVVPWGGGGRGVGTSLYSEVPPPPRTDVLSNIIRPLRRSFEGWL